MDELALNNLSVGTAEPIFYNAVGTIAERHRIACSGTNAGISILLLEPSGTTVCEARFGPTITNYSASEWQTTSTATSPPYMQSDTAPPSMTNLADWQSTTQLIGLPEQLYFSHVPSAILGRETDYGETIYLPHPLEELMDSKALHWLATEPELVSLLADMSLSIQNLFHDRGISATCQITTFADSEAEQASEKLLLEAKIANIPYSEILQLWDEVATRLLSNLPTEIQKKITIVLDEA